MEWVTKIPDLIGLPTKYFALASIVSGSLLLLPTELLTKLNLDSIPPPYGTLVGIVFLVTSGLVVINSVSWVGRKFDDNRVRTKRKNAILDTLVSLDSSERSVLREFYFGEQTTIKMPIDNPVVAGLVSRGVLRRVGSFGNHEMEGLMFSLRISKPAEELISLSILGMSEFQIPSENNPWLVTDEGLEWAGRNRPRFVNRRR